MDLLTEIYPNEYDKEKILKEIKKKDSKINPAKGDSLWKILLGKGVDFTFEIIANCIPMGTIAKKGIEIIVECFKKSNKRAFCLGRRFYA